MFSYTGVILFQRIEDLSCTWRWRLISAPCLVFHLLSSIFRSQDSGEVDHSEIKGIEECESFLSNHSAALT